jgi:hypothetical protein
MLTFTDIIVLGTLFFIMGLSVGIRIGYFNHDGIKKQLIENHKKEYEEH